ncbi:MAG: hypothetical protein WAT91_05630 [Saprospiraceae bacterium]
MLKKYTFWLKTAATLQILTAMLHSLSFINKPQGTNDTEKEMITLMTTNKMDMGAGFKPTMYDIITSMSIGFALMLILGGVINWYLLRKKAGPEILRGIIVINCIVFGISFIANFFLTFLPPIVCTGLIFFSLLLAYFTIPRNVSTVG